MSKEGRQFNCCQNELVFHVSKNVLKPFTRGHKVGHSFLQVPGIGYVGKYPSSLRETDSFLASIWNKFLSFISFAQIQNDGDLVAECAPENFIVEQVYRVCPKSLMKLKNQTASYFGLYVLSNSQCDNWCDSMLRDAGANIPQTPGALFTTPGNGYAPPVSKFYDSPAEIEINNDIGIFRTSFFF